jgi:lipopolysaccharide biosynthesis protein
MTKPRLIAFYLPQYHPVAENDGWWGKDFTDWVNVKKARPVFPKHDQPRVPSELGYYDLRDSSVRERQAELAKEYGIYGFCYYHYWFHGRRLLNRPFEEVLASGRPVFPFSLCWANENWSRRWDGSDHEILIEQKYSEEDDRRHIEFLIPVFKDPRYIRVQGKPLFLVYLAAKLPDPLKTIRLWRKIAEDSGLPGLYLCKTEAFGDSKDPRETGFDAAVQFPPHGLDYRMRIQPGVFQQILEFLGLSRKAYEKNHVFNYRDVAEMHLSRPLPDHRLFPCIVPSWDNTARRRNNALIIRNSSPALYEEWLRKTFDKYRRDGDENFVFINAWNEWAESAYLEPDRRFGRAYLEATRRALNG